MDYETFGENPRDGDKVTVILIKDEQTATVAAHVYHQNGTTDAWIIDRICEDLAMFGRAEIILRGDGEPAMMQVQGAVKNKRPAARSARIPREQPAREWSS